MATTPKISQRIALEGGEEIKRQFGEMGEKGKKAFKDIGKAIDESNQKLADVGKGAKAPLDDLTKSAGNAGEAMFTAGQKAVLAIGAIGLLGTALYSLAKAYIASAEAAAKFVSEQEAAATKAGQSTSNFQRVSGSLQQLGLTHAEAEQAIKKFGAGSAEAYAKGRAELKKLGISFAPTEAGARAASQMMGNLGDSVDSAGKKVSGTTELMKRTRAVFDPLTGTLRQDQKAWEDLAESVAKIQDPMKRSTFLTQQFGEELGRRLAKSLAGGKTAFAKEFEDFKRITGSETDAVIKKQEEAASAYERAMARWTAAAQGVRKRGGIQFAEFLTPLIEKMPEAELAFERLQEQALNTVSPFFKTTLKELGAIADFLTVPLPEAWRRYSRGANAAFDGMVAAATPAFLELSRVASAALEETKALLRIEPEDDLFSWLGRQFGTAWEDIKAAAPARLAEIKSLFNVQDGESAFDWLLRQYNIAWEKIKAETPKAVQDTKNLLKVNEGESTWDWILRTFQETWVKVKAEFEAAKADTAGLFKREPEGGGTWEWIVTTLDSAIAKALAKLQSLAARARAALTPAEGGAGAGAGGGELVEEFSDRRREPTARSAVRDGLRIANDIQKAQINAAKASAAAEIQLARMQKTAEASGKKIVTTYDNVRGVIRSIVPTADAAAGALRGLPVVDVIGQDQPKNLQQFKDSLVDTGLKAGETYKILKDGSVAVSQSTQDLLNAGKNLGQTFVNAGQKVGPAFTEMKALSNAAFTEMQAGPKKIADAFVPVTTAADTFKNNVAGLASAVGPAFGQVGLNLDTIKSRFEGLPATTEQFKTSLSTLAPIVDQSLGAAAQDAIELKAPVDQAAVSAANLGTSFTTGLTGVDAVIGGITDSIGALIEQITAAIAKMQELGAAQSESEGFGAAGAEGFARGGHVRGPGTSTSDSILARLSRGEFVQREKAVRYYGTDFMAALNALRIPKDMFRGFNAGGLVDGLNQSLSALMIPRFAVGGLANMAPVAASSGGRSLTLVLDGQKFSGLRGPDDTIARLEKHAIAQQTGSTGRKPSWVR